MIIVVILVVLIAVGAGVFVAVSKSKGGAAASPSRPASSPASVPARPASDGSRRTPEVPASPRERLREKSATAPRSGRPAPAIDRPDEADETDEVDDEPDLSRFGAAGAPKVAERAEKPPEPAVPFRYPMEAPIAEEAEEVVVEPVVAEEVIVEAPAVVEPPVAEEAPAPAPEPLLAFDLDRVLIAPLFGVWDDIDEADEVAADLAGPGVEATVTRLEPRPAPVEADTPLAEIVADLIDAADPEVAEVMARLIDSSDPDLVARLVDADDLAVAEVVAELLDAADDEVRSMVVDLADAPDRKQVAEVLRLVDSAYSGDAVGVLSPDIADQLDELDIESDLELTSRPAEMAQFARLENKDQLRVIIRVLCGLVAREDLPRSPRMPAVPASSAENRRWPLSRARWPVPPPDDEEIVKRAPLPARRADTKAS